MMLIIRLLYIIIVTSLHIPQLLSHNLQMLISKRRFLQPEYFLYTYFQSVHLCQYGLGSSNISTNTWSLLIDEQPGNVRPQPLKKQARGMQRDSARHHISSLQIHNEWVASLSQTGCQRNSAWRCVVGDGFFRSIVGGEAEGYVIAVWAISECGDVGLGVCFISIFTIFCLKPTWQSFLLLTMEGFRVVFIFRSKSRVANCYYVCVTKVGQQETLWSAERGLAEVT